MINSLEDVHIEEHEEYYIGVRIENNTGRKRTNKRILSENNTPFKKTF